MAGAQVVAPTLRLWTSQRSVEEALGDLLRVSMLKWTSTPGAGPRDAFFCGRRRSQPLAVLQLVMLPMADQRAGSGSRARTATLYVVSDCRSRITTSAVSLVIDRKGSQLVASLR